MLLDEASRYPERKLLMLCGHTHGPGEAQALPDLRVLTGGAKSGCPGVQRMIQVV